MKPGVETLRVRSLIPTYETVNNAVEFVKENTYTNAASPISEGSVKPESGMTLAISSAPVRCIAHWIKAAKFALDDLPTLKPYLDERLIDGLLDVEDNQLLFGDGLNQNLTGLCTSATAYAGTYNAAGDTRIDRLNHALTELEDAKFKPTGIVLNPADWRALQLIKTATGGVNTGEYLLGSPTGGSPDRIWNVQLALTHAISKGRFLVGDFTKTALWIRLGMIVELSTETDDDWVRNLVRLRAEMREALTTYRSDAFIFGSF